MPGRFNQNGRLAGIVRSRNENGESEVLFVRNKDCRMPSALLAAFVLGNVPLFLYPQDFVADISWPTHASVALPQGSVKPGEQLYVLENDAPIAAQIEVVAQWPDGSPKWVHAYASFRYERGKPARYVLAHSQTPPKDLPASRLQIRDEADGINVDTGTVKFRVSRPFAGVTLAESGGKVVISGEGGPSFVDDRGIAWHAMHDDAAELAVEQRGPAQVTIRASGWYQTAERRVAPFCRFVTRITAFANSSIIKFDHATIFAADMRKHAIAELAFKFVVPDVKGYASAASDTSHATVPLVGAFDERMDAAWFAQLSAQRMLVLSAKPGGGLHTVGTHGQSAGWFIARQPDSRVCLLTKDFWQKCPKEVKIGRDELTYYAWPQHGELATEDASALRPDGVYKFQCFLTGRLLDSRLPSEYFSALESQTDTQESKAQYARAANLEGVAIHNEFALSLQPPANGDDSQANELVAALERLYADSPIARASPSRMADSGALGPVAAAGSAFPHVEKAVHDGMLGYARSIERYGDYGWSIYGNAHHEELMNPAAAGVPSGRPSLHRVWSNDHYQHISTSWRLFALHGDPKLLHWARIASDNYASIGQVRYDELRGRVDGKGQHHPGPGVKYHNPGAFWHCKGFVPWGGRDYGMDSNDTDSGLTGHWPDPSALLLAWLIDANRWAKEGYELWLANVKFPSEGARREINTTLVHAITAYEYQPTPDKLAAIKGMVRGLMSLPLGQQNPGPLWEPTWLSRYHELFPKDAEFNKYLIENADTAGVRMEGVWSLALCATAYRITKDDKYLRRHDGTLARAARQVFYDPAPDKRWDQYGFGPGPDRDGQFLLEWHRFSAALRDAGIDSLQAPDEPGQYFCGVSRWDNSGDLRARGAKIIIWNDARRALELGVDAGTLSGGDIRATALELLSPNGEVALEVSRLPMSAATPKVVRRTRPSTWEVAHEDYGVSSAAAGLFTLRYASDEIGVFQPISARPECQVLQNSKTANWPEAKWFLAKLTRGHLLPLTRGKIQLTFTAMGRSDGSHIVLRSANDTEVLSRYLRAGDSVSVTLNQRGQPAGPWLLDAFSDHSGFFKLSITADVDEPLLYGRRLEDLELIRQKLAKKP
jgi:hypothetical protein